jgi:hypothetical protein
MIQAENRIEGPMKRWMAIAAVTCGCSGGADSDDVAKVKTPMPMDQVPAVVLKAAKEAEPGLTFYAAYKDKFDGQDSIELKGKTRTGKIKEIEVSPSGKVLGSE